MRTKEYRCQHCEGVFEETWTDEEADAEALKLWGVSNASSRDDMVRICDECHKRFMEWLNKRVSGG